MPKVKKKRLVPSYTLTEKMLFYLEIMGNGIVILKLRLEEEFTKVIASSINVQLFCQRKCPVLSLSILQTLTANNFRNESFSCRKKLIFHH